MTAAQCLDPELELFAHHFPGFGVVPGALLLAGRPTTDPPPAVVSVRDVRFTDFVRPGEPFAYHAGPGDVTEVLAGAGRLCCRLRVDPAPGPDVLGAPGEPVRPEPGVPTAPVRPRQLWLLPERLDLDPAARVARCRVDVAAVGRVSPYLRELAGWQVLVLVEALGNLALALQAAISAPTPMPPYVFAAFGGVAYRGEVLSQAPAVTVETRLQRAGALLVWEGRAYDADRVLIAVRRAVSRVWEGS